MAGVLAGLDRPQLALVLAALAHAGGSHEQVDVTVTETGLSFEPLPALVPLARPGRQPTRQGLPDERRRVRR